MSAQIGAPRYTYLKRGVYYFVTFICLLSVTYLNATQVKASPNETTSRFVRNTYMCEVGENQSLRPTAANDRDLSDIQFAFIHLDDDGQLDMVQGFHREPKNEFNVTKPLDYVVHLSSGTWSGPAVKALIARKFLIQDFNGDGRDDAVLLNAGNHKPPRKGLNNTILLSEGSGHTYKNLPGGSKISHGGGAGDLDLDGDVDILVSNGQQKSVQILINKGDGTFEAKSFLQPYQHGTNDYFYTAEIWDLDADGYLDIVLAAPKTGFVIYWGKASKKDKPTFSKKQRFNSEIFSNRLPLDMAFGDFDNDGFDEMAVIDTRAAPQRYRGWGISIMDFDGTRNPNAKSVYDDDPGQDYHWHGWIDACDVNKDKWLDLSAQMVGENELNAYPNVGKVEWINSPLGPWTQNIIDRSNLNFSGTKSRTTAPSISLPAKNIPNKASGQVNTNRPDGTTSSSEVCTYAVYDSSWNQNSPLWVEEAKRRGLSVEMCKLFLK